MKSNTLTNKIRPAIRWSRTALFGIVLALVGNQAVAQTTIISPTGDGGFETGATFAANNWNVVNTGTANGSQWFVTTATVTNGSYSFVPTGSRAAYISNNGGINWRYNTTGASSASHLYRDVTFPAGEPGATLSFRWNANGESGNWDILYVYHWPTRLREAVPCPLGPAQVRLRCWVPTNCSVQASANRPQLSYRPR